MNAYFNGSSRITGIASAFILMGLLAGCASTGQNTSTSTQSSGYTLPSAAFDGYWAMIQPINDSYGVVKFEDGMTENYRFTCHANGSYTQTGKETSQLVPSATGMGLKYGNDPIDSELRVVRIEPQKAMVINQRFIGTSLEEAYPNGINFSYVYTPTLTPLCPQ